MNTKTFCSELSIANFVRIFLICKKISRSEEIFLKAMNQLQATSVIISENHNDVVIT